MISVAKMSSDYRFKIRKKCVIKAVCEVSELSLRDMCDNFHVDSDSVYRKTVRNILADMLFKNAEMTYREIEDCIGVSLKQISNIVNREKTLMEDNIRKECFERYCQLMFENVRVCSFPVYRSVFKYRNGYDFSLTEILPKF